MSLLIALIIGALIGGAGGYFIMEGNGDYFLMNILAGVVGAIVGLALYFFAGTGWGSLGLYSWRGTASAAIGAIVAVLLFDGLHRLAPKRASHVATTPEDKGKAEEKLDED